MMESYRSVFLDYIEFLWDIQVHIAGQLLENPFCSSGESFQLGVGFKRLLHCKRLVRHWSYGSEGRHAGEKRTKGKSLRRGHLCKPRGKEEEVRKVEEYQGKGKSFVSNEPT